MPTTKTTVYTILLLHADTHAHGRVGNNKRIIGYRSYCVRAGSDNPRKRRAFVYTKPLTDGRTDGKGARAQTQGFYAYVRIIIIIIQCQCIGRSILFGGRCNRYV